MDGLQVEIAGMGGLSMKHFLIGFGGEAPDGTAARLDRSWPRRTGQPKPAAEGRDLPAAPRRDQAEPVGRADRGSAQAGAGRDRGGCRQQQPRARHCRDLLAWRRRARHRDAVVRPGTGEGGRAPATSRSLSPDAWHGEAHLIATGFDDLATQARTNPDLQQALPVLIMLRGLAKPDGERLVWDIVSDGPSVTVNGLDLSQLGGGDKPKGNRRRSPVSSRAGRA